VRSKRILFTLVLLNLFAIWMTVAAWRLLNQQTALADTVTAEQIASGFQGGLYVILGLSALLGVSTASTILLFWWPRKHV
jgi:hypothetical protein